MGGRIYAAYLPEHLAIVTGRLDGAAAEDEGPAALGRAAQRELPELFAPGDVQNLLRRLDDPVDALDDVSLYGAAVKACQQLLNVQARRLIQVEIGTNRTDSGYVAAVVIGGHSRELTVAAAREHAGAVMQVAARATHDTLLLRHLVEDVGLEARRAARQVREAASGRAPVDAAALRPLRIRHELTWDFTAHLQVWAPGTGAGGTVEVVWPVGVARGYAAQVLAAVEAARLHAEAHTWLRDVRGLGDGDAETVLSMITERA